MWQEEFSEKTLAIRQCYQKNPSRVITQGGLNDQIQFRIGFNRSRQEIIATLNLEWKLGAQIRTHVLRLRASNCAHQLVDGC